MSTKSARLFHPAVLRAQHQNAAPARGGATRPGCVPRGLPCLRWRAFRQILGWREYVRGIYWAHMPGYDERNALGHSTPLPDWFWTGKTRMRCMQHAVGQSLEQAHAHHIQRLMVIGNFALLAGWTRCRAPLVPGRVHRRL